MDTPLQSITHVRLRYNVLLETLTDAEFNQVFPYLGERFFGPGQIILEENTHGDEVFFLVEGRIRITKPTVAGEEHLLALLHPGDCFGELESIAGRTRSARVTAMDPCHVFALHRDHFEKLLHQSSALAHRLLQILSIRIRALNNHCVGEISRRVAHSQNELAKLERLIEAVKMVNSTLDLDELLDIIIEISLGIVNGDRGTVYVMDDQRQELWTRVAKGLDDRERATIRLPLGKGIAGYVAATGDTLNIPDAYLDPRFNPDFDRQTGYRTKSILCMPIRTKDGKIIGVFQLLNKKTGEFTEDDSRIMEALSTHAALALENARLYVQEKEKIRIERDLHAAREVQVHLLPPHVPSIAGYAFASTFVPARDVGGDLYNFIRRDDQHLGVCLGDVSGKGLPAALLMAHVQASLHDSALETPSASQCVRTLNARLNQSIGSERFVTLFYALMDLHGHAVQYSNAGHNPPLLLTRKGDVRWLDTGGTILGMLEDFPYEEETLTLSPGDVLVLYSDGITEAINAEGELFGEHRLQALVQNHGHESPVHLQEQILQAVRDHAGDRPAADDMTLVIIKRTAAL